MRRALLAGLWTILAVSAPLRGQQANASLLIRDTTQLEQALEQLRNTLGIPGLSTVIADHGRIIWQRGFGFANLERHIPVSPESTVFHLASLTKPYAAAVVLRLADEQSLDLSAPVASFGVRTRNKQRRRFVERCFNAV